MFSQHDEEKWVLKHAGKAGKFLDVGANDGVTFSNTHALALNGWTGVCIEPSPYWLGPLIKTYPDVQKFTIIAAALGASRCLCDFWSTEGIVNTTEKSMMEKWKEHHPYRLIMMPQSQVQIATRLPGSGSGSVYSRLISLPPSTLNCSLGPLRSARM